MATDVNVTFSGLALLRASRRNGRVGLLKGHGGHAKSHFPLVIVQNSQLSGDPSRRPQQVADLYKHVKREWLPSLTNDGWVGFMIDNTTMTANATYTGPALAIERPSQKLDCPTGDNWHDLGWLVNFSDHHPGMRLKRRWPEKAAVAFDIPPFGSVVGREPVDMPADRKFRLYRFAGRAQAFTDAFVWNTRIDGELTLQFDHRNGKTSAVTLNSAGNPLQLHVMNQPETLGMGRSGDHLAAFYDLEFGVPPGRRDLPEEIGICGAIADEARASLTGTGSGITISVKVNPQALAAGPVELKISAADDGGGTHDHDSHDPHEGGGHTRGEEYCMGGIVWCENEEDACEEP